MATPIVTQVQTILNDTGVFWPTQNILDAVNEAQFWVYAETKWAITSSTWTLNSGADVATFPSGILIPKWIEGTNSLFAPPVVKRFSVTTQRNLESFLRTWKGNNTGQPVYFSIWDATHLRVFPRPDATYTFSLYGVGFPTEVVTGTDVISGPTAYVNAVQQYSAALLLEATRPDVADMYMAQAQDKILAVKKRLRNQQSHNIRVLAPATGRYEISQGGQVSETPTYYPLEN